MENVIKKLLSLGADEVEIREEYSRRVEAPFKADELGPIKSYEGFSYGIRVVVDKRVAYTFYLGSPEGLEKVALKTLESAKASSKLSDRPGLPDTKETSSVSNIYSDSIASIVSGDYEPLIEISDRVIELAKENSVELARNSISFEESRVRVVNSQGIDKSYSSTFGVVTVNTLYGKGSTREFEFFRDLKELNLERLMENASKKAKDADKAEIIETFRGYALFEPPMSAELIEVMLARSINGEQVLKGASPLRGKENQEIASKGFSLYDDGTYPGGIRSSPIDDEGMPTERTPLIENGILKGFIYDRYHAHKANRKATGNGFVTRQGYPPATAPSNLIVERGKGSLEDLIADIDRGLMISSTIGARLSDPIGGIYNATVTLGYLIESGEIKKPVKGVVVNIPFRESLKDAIIGAEPYRHYMQAYAPPIVLPNATFAAKS